jgi:hypothetical protein
METQQMMELLLARMDANTKTNQEHMKEIMESQIGSLVSRMEADRKTNQEEIRASLEQMASLVSQIEANYAKTDVNLQEMREEITSGQAKMRSIVNAWKADMKDDRKETMPCHVTIEVCLYSKELNPEDKESEVEHQEVPTEEATVKSSGTMKKQHRGRYLAAGRHREPKELTHGNCGSQRKLAVAYR